MLNACVRNEDNCHFAKKVGPVQVRTQSDLKVQSTYDLDLNLKKWVWFTSYWPGPSDLWIRSGPNPGP